MPFSSWEEKAICMYLISRFLWCLSKPLFNLRVHSPLRFTLWLGYICSLKSWWALKYVTQGAMQFREPPTFHPSGWGSRIFINYKFSKNFTLNCCSISADLGFWVRGAEAKNHKFCQTDRSLLSTIIAFLEELLASRRGIRTKAHVCPQLKSRIFSVTSWAASFVRCFCCWERLGPLLLHS